MKAKAIVFGIAAGVLGAIVWAAIAHFAQVEIGYVAWAIGGLVGVAACLGGGGGASNGILCAVITLVSIFAGKMLAVRASFGEGMDQVARGIHKELLKDANDFAKVKGDDGIKAFMVKNEYTEAKKAAGVTDEELGEFKETDAAMLLDLAEKDPSFEEWKERDDVKAMLGGIEGILDAAGIALGGLTPIDIIFGLLGIATAFKLGSRPADPDAVVQD